MFAYRRKLGLAMNICGDIKKLVEGDVETGTCL